MRRNCYLWTAGVNWDTTVRLADPEFLLECKISTIWQRFPLIFHFCFLYAECPPYLYFRFVWPTDLESIPHASTPAWIISTKFEVHTTIRCWVIAFLSADTARDLVTLTVDRLTLNSCLTWRVTWSTTPPSLMTLRLFVHELTSYNVSHWLPLKMRTRPLRMRRITWPVNRGSKTITFFGIPNRDLPIQYTTFIGLPRRLRVFYCRAV